MTKEELAALLDGNEYRREITKELELEARKSGLVVLFGASDDLLEVRGAIDDELSGGNCYFLTGTDICYSEDVDSEPNITMDWNSGDESTFWTFWTDIPCSAFMIYDEGEPYCEGIVIDLTYFKEKESENYVLALRELLDEQGSCYYRGDDLVFNTSNHFVLDFAKFKEKFKLI